MMTVKSPCFGFTCCSGNVAAAVPFFTVLVVEHGVTMRERAASAVFAREAHANAFVHQRGIGEVFGHTPAERLLDLPHRPCGRQSFFRRGGCSVKPSGIVGEFLPAL